MNGLIQRQKTSETWKKAGKLDFLRIFDNPPSKDLTYKSFLNAMAIFRAIYQYYLCLSVPSKYTFRKHQL